MCWTLNQRCAGCWVQALGASAAAPWTAVAGWSTTAGCGWALALSRPCRLRLGASAITPLPAVAVAGSEKTGAVLCCAGGRPGHSPAAAPRRGALSAGSPLVRQACCACCASWLSAVPLHSHPSWAQGTFLLRFGSQGGVLVLSVQGRTCARHYEMRAVDIQSSKLEVSPGVSLHQPCVCI